MSASFFGLRHTGSLPNLLKNGDEKKTETEKMKEESTVFNMSMKKYEMMVESIQSQLKHLSIEDHQQIVKIITKCHIDVQKTNCKYLLAGTSKEMKPLNKRLAEVLFVVETSHDMISHTINSNKN